MTAADPAPASPAPQHGHAPKQDRSRVTRERILESTIEALAERGWQATTTTVVAERIGISRGALQHHFRTREDLFLTALDAMFERNLQLTMRDEERLPDGDERFDVLVARIMDYYTSDAFTAALHVWTAAAGEPALRDRILPLEAKFARGVFEQAVELLDADISDERTRRLIQLTLDLARGLGLADVLTDDSARRARIAKFWAGELRSIKRR
ncbi:TetR family transcriptional regulator [Brevibacterium sp. 5221]|uniref:TetR family transcriptional regulator n=1 Tax=Brevibacterium rongguiense TaxID=2695267 RepID=A0A6N9H4X6_9MICO|nr:MULTISPECIES: TetR/AcrR family transcriptional regulator [Brevibacterium]MYM19117.1 TetR family transcriptional regulator [Brevibacterium rongguiense]WAL40645.1 TetR/AcrR family transcriptional regulator [Brevibacterium sp. BRM-1]